MRLENIVKGLFLASTAGLCVADGTPRPAGRFDGNGGWKRDASMLEKRPALCYPALPGGGSCSKAGKPTIDTLPREVDGSAWGGRGVAPREAAALPEEPSELLQKKSVLDAADVINGDNGSGALYRIVRPTQWNGDLLLYAHPLVSRNDTVALPVEGDLIVSLLAPQGFAVAYSSFSKNGWAVEDGAKSTYQLLEIFTSKFGRPKRVYVAGLSLGGLIAIKLAETHPADFSGVLPACAVASGTRHQFEYAAHARALFDFFYPGVLPGNAADLPPGVDVDKDIVQPAIAAMTANPNGTLIMAKVDQTPFPFASPDELIQSIATALGDNASAPTELLPFIDGHPYFDNQHTVYSGTALAPKVAQNINAGVQRFHASSDVLHELDRNYTPSGQLQVPMLMLSVARDPVVPGFNQKFYQEEVAEERDLGRLVQQEVPGYGHCTFTPEQLGAAFTDLILWVEQGIKPTP